MTSVLQAQTVDEIISKHIEAIGGNEVLSKVKSIYTENSMDVMGNQVPLTEFLLEGKGYKTESEFNGAKIISCFNSNGGWSVNPMMGASDAQPMGDDLYNAGKNQIYIGGPLVDYASKGYKAELAGKEDGNFKIRITGKNSESFYFIDPKSFYISKSIIKSEMMGQPVDVTTTYSEYKKTDSGLVMAFAKSIDMGMFQMSVIVNKVDVNKELDPKIFEIPK